LEFFKNIFFVLTINRVISRQVHHVYTVFILVK